MTQGMDQNNMAAAPQPDDEGRVLEWTSHPVKRKPLAAVLVTIFVVVTGILVYTAMNSKAFAVLALVVLLISLAKFYLPTKYRLTDKRIMIKTTTQTLYKEWSHYRSFYPDKNGILLSPFPVPSRLENFRGVYLIFSENKEEVTDFVREHLENKNAGAGSAEKGNGWDSLKGT